MVFRVSAALGQAWGWGFAGHVDVGRDDTTVKGGSRLAPWLATALLPKVFVAQTRYAPIAAIVADEEKVEGAARQPSS